MTESELIRRIHSVFINNAVMLDNWGHYLFGDEYSGDKDKYLRWKIGVICWSALFDSIEFEDNSKMLDTYYNRARELEKYHLIYYCNMLRKLNAHIRNILKLYSREEQIFILDYRDQLVHSWLIKTQGRTFNIKYYDGIVLVKEKIERRNYYEIVNKFYEIGLEKSLPPLMERFLNLKHRYFDIISMLRSDGLLKEMSKAMIRGEQIKLKYL